MTLRWVLHCKFKGKRLLRTQKIDDFVKMSFFHFLPDDKV